MSWSRDSLEVLPCDLDLACICSDVAWRREKTQLNCLKASQVLKRTHFSLKYFVELGPELLMLAFKHCAHRCYSCAVILSLGWKVAQIYSYYKFDTHCSPQQKIHSLRDSLKTWARVYNLAERSRRCWYNNYYKYLKGVNIKVLILHADVSTMFPLISCSVI